MEAGYWDVQALCPLSKLAPNFKHQYVPFQFKEPGSDDALSEDFTSRWVEVAFLKWTHFLIKIIWR